MHSCCITGTAQLESFEYTLNSHTTGWGIASTMLAVEGRLLAL